MGLIKKMAYCRKELVEQIEQQTEVCLKDVKNISSRKRFNQLCTIIAPNY